MVALGFRMWSSYACALCVAFVILGGCGGATEVTGSAGAAGTSGTGDAGGGGSHTGTGGSSSSAGSNTTGGDTTIGGPGGSSGVGGTGNGGSAGANTGGAGGREGGMCPAAEPTVGSPCDPTIHVSCFYGSNPCCGGAYTCNNGRWAALGLGCACLPPPQDAGSDTRPSDASSDAPFSCGTATCGADQFCVHPSTNLCGPAPQCVPMTDAGTCPPGTTYNSFCVGSPTGGCVEIPMRGPPHCATLSSSCGANPSMCSCLPRNACGPSGADVCQRIQGRDISCTCIAP